MGEDLFERWLEDRDVSQVMTLFGVSGLLKQFDQWLWWEGHLVKKENWEEFLKDYGDTNINDIVLLFGVRGLLDGFERWLNRNGYLIGHKGPE